MDIELYKEFGIKWLKCMAWTIVFAVLSIVTLVAMELIRHAFVHVFGDYAVNVAVAVLIFLAITGFITLLTWDELD